MKIPIIRGVVRRRLLVNYRVDADVMKEWLPAPFEPMLHRGWAVAGVCLIRVEQMPRSLARFGRGLGSENAAHRVAVRWPEGSEIHEGAYVCASHTDSLLGHLARSGVLPGEQHRARFRVQDDGREIGLSMQSAGRSLVVELTGHAAAAMPPSSIFGSIREASTFFERGSVGYAPSHGGRGYVGVAAEAHGRAIAPPDGCLGAVGSRDRAPGRGSCDAWAGLFHRSPGGHGCGEGPGVGARAAAGGRADA